MCRGSRLAVPASTGPRHSTHQSEGRTESAHSSTPLHSRHCLQMLWRASERQRVKRPQSLGICHFATHSKPPQPLRALIPSTVGNGWPTSTLPSGGPTPPSEPSLVSSACVPPPTSTSALLSLLRRIEQCPRDAGLRGAFAAERRRLNSVLGPRRSHPWSALSQVSNQRQSASWRRYRP